MTRTQASVALTLAALLAGAASATPAVGERTAAAGDAAIVKTLLLERSDLPASYKDIGRAGPSTGCFSPVSSAMTAKASSHEFERSAAATDSVLQSGSALYRTPAAARAVFTKLYFSKKSANCYLAQFTRKLPAKDKVSGVKIVPVRLSVGPLRLAAWDIRLHLSNGKVDDPVEIVVTGYLVGRAMSQLLAFADGVDRTLVTATNHASAAVTQKLHDAKI